MKKLTTIVLSLVTMLFGLFSFMSDALRFSPSVSAATVINELEEKTTAAMPKVIGNELDNFFEGKKIKSSMVLYSLDDSPDYTAVEFETGYAIFFKETMELLEYSPLGKLPYPEKEQKYYAGLKNYFTKEEECFVDTITGESALTSDVDTINISRKMRSTMFNTEFAQNTRNQKQSTVFDIFEIAAIQSTSSTEKVNGAAYNVQSGTYIQNYKYFLTKPTHGNNTNGTCGAVAAQLLLSYNNYYVDRNLIDNRHLNGNSTTEKERNPNFCSNPESMTPDTLGTRGRYEDGSDDPNSYFRGLVNRIGSNTYPWDVSDGIEGTINQRNTELEVTRRVSFYTSWGTLPLGFVNAEIRNEIDEDRPVIIGTLAALGGQRDHWQVGYGYTGSTLFGGGFWVHMGYDIEGEEYKWINQSLGTNSYVKLRVAHTHLYSNSGVSFQGNTIYTCSICGHRTFQAPSSTWQQPEWTRNTNGHGSITASGTHGNEYPWKAFNGTRKGGSSPNCDNWSVNATKGWLHLRLNYYINVQRIEFYNGVSSGSNRTKAAKFTGRGGAALGGSFTAPNKDYGYVDIQVGNVLTNVIQLNISSSYGEWVGAGMIIIHGTIPATQPSAQTWTQPIWSSSSNEHGTVAASGTYGNEYPWKAFNGTRKGGTAPNCDNWSVKATSGWIELRLEYPICVTSIELWNGVSSSSNRTKLARFTGVGPNGTVELGMGKEFTLGNSNYAYRNVTDVPPGGVWTSIIRLRISSSYGSYVCAGMIAIHATV